MRFVAKCPQRPICRGALRPFLLACFSAVAAGCGEPTMVATEPPLDGGAVFGIVPETWTFSDLGNLGVAGNVHFSTHAVNDSGHIVGAGRSLAGPNVAWRWRDGVFVTTLPTDSSWGGGYGLNTRGDIFGKRSSDQVTYTNLIWHFEPGYNTQSGFIRHTKGADEEGQDINDFGYATGYNCVPYGVSGACRSNALLWRPTKAASPWSPTVIALGPLGDWEKAFAINNVGTVLGYASVNNTSNRAWINTLNGPMEALPVGPLHYESWPGDINDSNVSVGVARTVGTYRYRFVKWGGMSRPIDLGLPMDADSYPNQRAPIRISNKGRIAGNAQNLPFTLMAGVMTLLPVPNGTNAVATGINTCGEIVGTVSFPNNGGKRVIRWRRMMSSLPVCD